MEVKKQESAGLSLTAILLGFVTMNFISFLGGVFLQAMDVSINEAQNYLFYLIDPIAAFLGGYVIGSLSKNTNRFANGFITALLSVGISLAFQLIENIPIDVILSPKKISAYVIVIAATCMGSLLSNNYSSTIKKFNFRWISTILVVLGLVGYFISISFVSIYAFWFVVVGYVLLWLGNSNLTSKDFNFRWISTVLFFLGLVGTFVIIPFVSPNAFWFVVVGYVLLWLGNAMKGF